MGKRLIIAEKPSVASDIAKALGGFTKKDEFFESKDFVLSSAVGHLVELCLPNELDKKKGKWSFANLPIIPDEFALKPIERSEARLKVLKKLIKRDDVDVLINACDAGREGELIFRYIVKLCGSKKPIERLWLQSMTPTSIRDGFHKLKPGSELEPLAQAAVCRSESDWLVGINGTRALTAFNSRNGGFQLTPVGRVQTPTLAIVVERDLKIKHFQSKNYWEIHGVFQAKAGTYEGRWLDETFKKSEKEEESDHRAERLWSEEEALKIQAKCQGKSGVVTEEKKPSSQLSPLLYDLTTLQRESNGRFGLSAKRTLQLAQALYERHKVLTYPRTDSRALPEDYLSNTRDVLRTLGQTSLAPFAQKILDEDWVKPTKRVFNNAKISDHHAIIPTQQAPAGLDEWEQRVYDLVAKRFLAVFYPAAQFEITTRLTKVEEELFKTDGKILISPGWMAIYGKEEHQEDSQPSLVPVEEKEKVATEKIEVRALQTKPPAHFTEATLLSAMEGAGKLVDDEELREAMAAKGLGTPATRAAIIEGLLGEEYMRREGREIISTPKALALIELLQALEVPGLQSPEMTGEWEYKLKQIEKGSLSRDAFMHEIVDLTKNIVDRAKYFEESGLHSKPLDFKSPDGAPMIETLRDYRSEDGKFQLRKVVAGRLLEPHEAHELIEKKFIGPLTGFRSRLGRPFSAAIKLTDDFKTEFVFDNAPIDNEGHKLDLSTQEPIGICPIDGSRVFETLMSFSCEHAFDNPASCQFKIGKKILGQEITREQAMKLMTTKKTDLLTKFYSQKTRRPFSAYLVLGPEGKTAFEFLPRAQKPNFKKAAAMVAARYGAGKEAAATDGATPASSESNEKSISKKAIRAKAPGKISRTGLKSKSTKSEE